MSPRPRCVLSSKPAGGCGHGTGRREQGCAEHLRQPEIEQGAWACWRPAVAKVLPGATPSRPSCADLDGLRVLIAERWGGLDRAAALSRLWLFMDVARRVGLRVRDRDGELGAVFSGVAISRRIGAISGRRDPPAAARRTPSRRPLTANAKRHLKRFTPVGRHAPTPLLLTLVPTAERQRCEGRWQDRNLRALLEIMYIYQYIGNISVALAEDPQPHCGLAPRPPRDRPCGGPGAAPPARPTRAPRPRSEADPSRPPSGPGSGRGRKASGPWRVRGPGCWPGSARTPDRAPASRRWRGTAPRGHGGRNRPWPGPG